MSELRERIVEVLEEHEAIYWNRDKGTVHCDCHAKMGEARKLGGHDATHRAHQAEMLAPIIRDAQRQAWQIAAEAWDEGATAASEGYDLPDAAQIHNPYRKEI